VTPATVTILVRLLLTGFAALFIPLCVTAQEDPPTQVNALAGIPAAGVPAAGDAARGRLIFGPCRTCHSVEPSMGHNNGPNLHRIFGKVAGKQAGFGYYSQAFESAEFVWTPQLMYSWLENTQAMFPDSNMMSPAIPDPQRRADLIAYLKQASARTTSDSKAAVTDGVTF
jgi:cytochrome c